MSGDDLGPCAQFPVGRTIIALEAAVMREGEEIDSYEVASLVPGHRYIVTAHGSIPSSKRLQVKPEATGEEAGWISCVARSGRQLVELAEEEEPEEPPSTAASRKAKNEALPLAWHAHRRAGTHTGVTNCRGSLLDEDDDDDEPPPRPVPAQPPPLPPPAAGPPHSQDHAERKRSVRFPADREELESYDVGGGGASTMAAHAPVPKPHLAATQAAAWSGAGTAEDEVVQAPAARGAQGAPATGARRAQPTPEVPQDERHQLIWQVFQELDAIGNVHRGRLGPGKLRRYAELRGFDGDSDDWAVEYGEMCHEFNWPARNGVDVLQFIQLVDNERKCGGYATDDELRDCLVKLREGATSGAPRGSWMLRSKTAELKGLKSSDDLLATLFRLLDEKGEGRLGVAATHKYAVLCGFDGDEEEWALAFSELCLEYQWNPRLGADPTQFAMLVHDQDGRGYCSDQELVELISVLRFGNVDPDSMQQAARVTLKRAPTWAGGSRGRTQSVAYAEDDEGAGRTQAFASDDEEPAPKAKGRGAPARSGPAEHKYVVDNSVLKSKGVGVAYRCSKQLDDVHDNQTAEWGSVVSGIDLGDGWLCVDDLFLPMVVKGVKVLVPLESSHDVLMKGWLEKRGPVAEYGWQRRWCILRAGVLECYTDESMDQKKGSVELGPFSCAVEFSAPGAPGEAESHRRERPYGFVLDVNPSAGKQRRLHYFDAEGKKEVGEWKGAVSSTATALRAAATQEYLIDNSQMHADTLGLGYRFSKNLDDLNPKLTANWGAKVVGVVTADGWLQVGDMYLPVELQGRRVIVPTAGMQDGPPLPVEPPKGKNAPQPGFTDGDWEYISVASNGAQLYDLPQKELVGRALIPFGEVVRVCERGVKQGVMWLRLQDGRGWAAEKPAALRDMAELFHEDVPEELKSKPQVILPKLHNPIPYQKTPCKTDMFKAGTLHSGTEVKVLGQVRTLVPSPKDPTKETWRVFYRVQPTGGTECWIAGSTSSGDQMLVPFTPLQGVGTKNQVSGSSGFITILPTAPPQGVTVYKTPGRSNPSESKEEIGDLVPVSQTFTACGATWYKVVQADPGWICDTGDKGKKEVDVVVKEPHWYVYICRDPDGADVRSMPSRVASSKSGHRLRERQRVVVSERATFGDGDVFLKVEPPHEGWVPEKKKSGGVKMAQSAPVPQAQQRAAAPAPHAAPGGYGPPGGVQGPPMMGGARPPGMVPLIMPPMGGGPPPMGASPRMVIAGGPGFPPAHSMGPPPGSMGGGLMMVGGPAPSVSFRSQSPAPGGMVFGGFAGAGAGGGGDFGYGGGGGGMAMGGMQVVSGGFQSGFGGQMSGPQPAAGMQAATRNQMQMVGGGMQQDFGGGFGFGGNPSYGQSSWH